MTLPSSMTGPGILLTLLVLLPCPTSAAEDPELQALRARVARLEEQNRAILAALERLEAERAGEPHLSPAPAAPVAGSDTPKAEVLAGKSKVDFYGFLRLDMIYDDSQTNGIQTPTLVLSEDASLGGGGHDSSNLHPRLTRFGMSYTGPPVRESGPRLTGKIEIDFQNGGRESRQVPRLRQGYLSLGWDDGSLLVGQTWDVISPLFPTVNADTLMWNAGNLGDRRPQIRYTRTSKHGGGTWTFEGAVAATGAVDGQDLDNDGVRDGDDAVLPNLQARVGYAGVMGSAGSKWAVGLSGHFGRQDLRTPVAGEDRFSSSSLNLDFHADLSPRVALQGELWTGSNLGDFRGGVGQSVNAATGEEIGSSGGWIELGFKATESYSFYTGFTLDDPDDDAIGSGRPTQNGSAYLVNRFRLAPAFTLGLDYLRWETEYKGLDDGTDNRFNLYFVYNL